MNKQITMDEMQYYLEEMVAMELHTPLEEEVYYLLLEGKKVSPDKLGTIKKRMNKWYKVRF